jgi:hypothetical protein
VRSGSTEIRIGSVLKSTFQAGPFDPRPAFQRLLAFDIAAIRIDHPADGNRFKPGLLKERHNLFRQQAVVIEERVTVERGVAGLWDGEML